MSIVSQRLQAARGKLGLSRYQAGRQLGLVERRVRQNESGDAQVLFGELMAYRQLYGVSEDWLRGGSLESNRSLGAGRLRDGEVPK
jgi:transcriptional regulator with XRE-family HTH domain